MCLETPVHVYMCVFYVVCKCRAGGGGQEPLWSPEEGTGGDQSQNWRVGCTSFQPRYRALKLRVLALPLHSRNLEVLKGPSFAFQSSTQLPSASLVSSIWWALWTAHYTTTLMEVSLFLSLFPLLHLVITLWEISEPFCFLFCWIDVTLNVFSISKWNLHISLWPNVLTSISIYFIIPVLSDADLILPVVVSRHWSELYHSDPSTYTFYIHTRFTLHGERMRGLHQRTDTDSSSEQTDEIQTRGVWGVKTHTRVDINPICLSSTALFLCWHRGFSFECPVMAGPIVPVEWYLLCVNQSSNNNLGLVNNFCGHFGW